jgi:hypothetical protein
MEMKKSKIGQERPLQKCKREWKREIKKKKERNNNGQRGGERNKLYREN